MASVLSNKAKQEMLAAYLTGCKLMLLKSTYVPDPDHDGVDHLTAYEIDATNYAKGYGQAGRKAATITVNQDDAGDAAKVVIDDVTWTALGGVANDTIGAVALIKEAGGNDAGSRIVAIWDLTDTATNGGDVTLDFAALGNITI